MVCRNLTTWQFSLVLVYPTIEDDELPGKVKWKPGMKKKKSERVDATWNPKGQEPPPTLLCNKAGFPLANFFARSDFSLLSKLN